MASSKRFKQSTLGESSVVQKREKSNIITGDALLELPKLAAESFQCSPPYWGLRDYAIDGQLGAENTLEEYIEKVVRIFREVRRVLRADGTLWLVVGDSYTSGNRATRDPDKKNAARGMSYRPPTPAGLKPKDLIGVPWKIAFALQQDGWYLRSDVVWYKPNCQPESVRDRPTKSHEYVFLLTKSEDYFYNSDAVKEPALHGEKRNRRSLWSVSTVPFKVCCSWV